MVKVVQWRDLFDQQQQWPSTRSCRRQQQDSQPPAGNRGGQSGLAAVLDGVWWSGPGLSPGETGDSVGDFLELGVGLLSS